MKCPTCGYQLDAFTAECPRCARLGDQAVVTPMAPSVKSTKPNPFFIGAAVVFAAFAIGFLVYNMGLVDTLIPGKTRARFTAKPAVSSPPANPGAGVSDPQITTDASGRNFDYEALKNMPDYQRYQYPFGNGFAGNPDASQTGKQELSSCFSIEFPQRSMVMTDTINKQNIYTELAINRDSGYRIGVYVEKTDEGLSPDDAYNGVRSNCLRKMEGTFWQNGSLITNSGTELRWLCFDSADKAGNITRTKDFITSKGDKLILISANATVDDFPNVEDQIDAVAKTFCLK